MERREWRPLPGQRADGQRQRTQHRRTHAAAPATPSFLTKAFDEHRTHW